MKCPLSKSVIRVGNEASIGTMVDCLKEECAWWHPTTVSCEVSRIASNLSGINNALIGVLYKIGDGGEK
uniref:Uncharacterized protein n=1 Tax=viral metagenome TaxID=1070528 RepID=A0A6H2A5W3_9ZZZZ